MIRFPAFSRRSFLQTTTTLAGALALPRVSFGAEVRPAPGMPAPRFVQTNGIRMAVYEQGSGTPVVFCHGFPELAFSWRYQLPALAEADSLIRSQTSESWTMLPSTSRAGGWSVSVRSPNS